MARVIIGDDHALIREGLRNVLAREPDMQVAGEAGDRAALVALAESTPADVLLMDINMPGCSAAEALQRLRSRCPQLPVLILSMLPEEQVALGFLRMGAAGYVSKDAAAAELVAAIRAALAGKPYLSGTLARRIASRDTGPHELLSPRELEVLRFIASGFAVKEIAGRLSLSASTVHTHRARILHKLQLRSDVELSRYAMRHRLVD
ncbi:MAG TPA: response regulator transcription factor [Burkholderiales bacterium]|nr:response regulator transcription factor [Burkholderiales bacterium]